jgi:micrococcal nuclease
MLVSLLLFLFAGCRGLDSVEIVAGEHCAPDREEEVACVLDGDTFELGTCGGESVRLLGINAPEIAHSDSEEPECWGPESAAWVTSLLAGAQVRLEFDATCSDTYGRTLAYVWYTDSDGEEQLANTEIVRLGHARVFEDFDDIRLAERLYAAQADALSAGNGLWGACE